MDGAMIEFFNDKICSAFLYKPVNFFRDTNVPVYAIAIPDIRPVKCYSLNSIETRGNAHILTNARIKELIHRRATALCTCDIRASQDLPQVQ